MSNFFNLLSQFENIEIENNLIFIDIDQTFGGSVDSVFINDDNDKIDQWIKFKKDNDLYRVHARDIANLNENSMKLFAELVHTTNAKVITISSWGSRKDFNRSIESIKTVFEYFADFPEDWLIGIASSSANDRNKEIVTPLIENIDFKNKHIIIDDNWISFHNKDNAVKVDGLLGFNIYNFIESLNILNIDSDMIKNRNIKHIVKLNRH